MAICAVLRDGLLRRSEAAKLRWQDVVFQSSGARGVLLDVRRSKIDQSSAGATVFAGPAADLLAIRPTYLDPEALVFGIADGQIGRRVRASAVRAGLGDGYTGHVGMAQDLAAAATELITDLQNAGRWQSPSVPAMPAPYSRGQRASRGAVAMYYGGSTGDLNAGWPTTPPRVITCQDTL